MPFAGAPPRRDSRLWWAAARAETGVLGRVERVRATPGAALGLLADDGVDALGVWRCGVLVGVSRPVVAGGFLATLAILLLCVCVCWA